MKSRDAFLITDLIYKLFTMQRSRGYYLDERTVRIEIGKMLKELVDDGS